MLSLGNTCSEFSIFRAWQPLSRGEIRRLRFVIPDIWIMGISTNDDEKWYIDFIKSNPNLKGVDLRRVIEGLGKTGSKRSIPIMREIAALHKDDEYIIDTCFWSIENVYAVKGTLIEITEKDLFEESKVT